jgi:hypothetical protein
MILSLQQSIVAGLSEAMTDLKSVVSHGGAFSESELKRWAVLAPCGIVVPIRVGSSKMVATNLVVDVDWSFFIVTRGTSQENRHNEALNLSSLAMRKIANNRWSNTSAQVAKDIAWESLYSSSLDGSGVAIDVVTWTQGVDIGDGFAEGDFVELQKIYTDMAVTSDQETIHGEDLIQLAGD